MIPDIQRLNQLRNGGNRPPGYVEPPAPKQPRPARLNMPKRPETKVTQYGAPKKASGERGRIVLAVMGGDWMTAHEVHELIDPAYKIDLVGVFNALEHLWKKMIVEKRKRTEGEKVGRFEWRRFGGQNDEKTN